VFFVLFVFILCFSFPGICTGNLLGFLCCVHNTENLKDYQYRCQKKTKHRMKTNKTKNITQKT
jgi:hypothetical protein